ncbi:hypothetical protein PIB30_066412 [Stylosanthes scabra]|uniref:Uncharacterized protein n=1 Tax=Stylosanthes scabra TaxID=79078 RepID=A0ABU6RMM7_9FABA|nr:hypothetical protein [Stylosanthes scabra]
MLRDFLLHFIVSFRNFHRTGNPWVGGSHPYIFSAFSDAGPGAPKTLMASGGRGRGRDRRGNDRNIPMDNQAEFLAAMTNLANTIQAGVAAMNQARGNENVDHQAGGGLMT